MRIGVTGHQTRDEIDWAWVKNMIGVELSKIVNVEQCLSSLAAGSDQVFAEVALDLGIPVLAVIPVLGYERYFRGNDLRRYRRLLHRCKATRLNWLGDDERGFFEAGKTIVEKSDMMFAVWDGRRAEGEGGTGDVIIFALKNAKPIVHINPIDRSIRRV